jgi:hypothetical protein
MSCRCARERSPRDIVEAMDRSYEFLGIPGVARRYQDVCLVKGKAIQAIERSDRARALGFDAALAEGFQSQAIRYRTAAVRSMRSLRIMIDDRLQQPEWREFLGGLQLQAEVGGDPSQLMDELLTEARDQLLASELPPADAAEVYEVVQSGAEIGRSGLEPALQALSRSLADFEEVLQRDTFGREQASPSTAEYIACTVAAVAAFIAAGVGCSYIPFCWCCIFPLLLLGFLAWIAACEGISRD